MIALLAAEQSGDQLGAGLLTALKRPAFGMGGPLLQAAGLEILSQPTHVMGVSDVVFALPRLAATFYRLKRAICQRAPSHVLTIDSPDFFLPLHRALRRAGYRGKLIHVVSPSVWAWRKNRITSMAKTLDLLITLFPFEASYYAGSGLPVSTITHPLAYEILSKQLVRNPQPIIALFPGSRKGEILRNLPAQLKAAQLFPSHQIVLCLAQESLRECIPAGIETVAAQERYALMAKAEGAIATSGTICLELALHRVPTVASYALSPLNYFLGHKVFKIHLPWYTLPNLILGRGMIPEYIDRHLSAGELARSLKRVLEERETFEGLATQFSNQFSLETSPYEKAAALLELR